MADEFGFFAFRISFEFIFFTVPILVSPSTIKNVAGQAYSREKINVNSNEASVILK